MARISVVLPVFNAARTVDEALASITSQTLRDIEIIAVNDGSTDDTSAILDRWATQDNRIRVLHRAHGGVIEAANAGLRAATAPLIARMDADDRMHPERLAQQATLLAERPEIDVASCLVSGFGRVREGFRVYMDWLNSCVTPEQVAREMFVESVIPNPTVLFRRELLQAVGYFEERNWPEDYDYWLRAHLAGVRFAKVPQVLHEWREHPQRLTRTDSRYSLENFIRVKAHYLMQGPLVDRDAVLIWGAGMMGKRVSKHLLRAGAPIVVFIDIDPVKIGRTRRGKPIIAPEALLDWWSRFDHPVLLAAVGARGARALIRERLTGFGLTEGRDWWGVA